MRPRVREYEKLVKTASRIEKGLRLYHQKHGQEYIIKDDGKIYLTVSPANTMSEFKFEVYYLNRSEDNMGGYLRSYKRFIINIDTDEDGNVMFYVTTETPHIMFDIINKIIDLFIKLEEDMRDKE